MGGWYLSSKTLSPGLLFFSFHVAPEVKHMVSASSSYHLLYAG